MCSLKPGLGGLSSSSDVMFLQAQRENYKLNIGSWKVKGNKYLLPTEFEVHIVSYGLIHFICSDLWSKCKVHSP